MRSSQAKYESLGGLIGEVSDKEVKEFTLENSYYIGDITADDEIERWIIDRTLILGNKETKIFNTYAMGTLTNCVTYGDKEDGLFGEKAPKNLASAASQDNIKRLYGYNDDLDSDNKHCADSSGNLNDCTNTELSRRT